jgi:hypothetical protein
MIIPIHIRYANAECPYCDAEPTQPCRADTGYNYDFRYTHAERRDLWWWRELHRLGKANSK